MLQHEFEKLTGLKIDQDQYEVINGMYMCDDNQTKQEFCKSFMEMGLMAHVNYVVRLKAEEAELRKASFELMSQRDMWRDSYCKAKEQAAVMEATIKRVTEALERTAVVESALKRVTEATKDQKYTSEAVYYLPRRRFYLETYNTLLNKYFFVGCYIVKTRHFGRNVEWMPVIGKILYVHQLQNILRDMGIEKGITI